MSSGNNMCPSSVLENFHGLTLTQKDDLYQHIRELREAQVNQEKYIPRSKIRLSDAIAVCRAAGYKVSKH